jgi:hypothetical protein
MDKAWFPCNDRELPLLPLLVVPAMAIPAIAVLELCAPVLTPEPPDADAEAAATG